MQMSAIYNKGLTTRSVNQAGQVITSDIQRSLNSSRVTSVKAVTDGNGDISDPNNTTATGGRLCVGQRVYAWNYGKALAEGTSDNPNANSFNKYSAVQKRPIRMVRFTSTTIDYCAKMMAGNYPAIPVSPSVEVTDLLSDDDIDLAINRFTINSDTDAAGVKMVGQPVKDDSLQRMYQLSIIIGTNEESIMKGNAAGCQTPKNSIDDQYCAVNQFDFTARAGTN